MRLSSSRISAFVDLAPISIPATNVMFPPKLGNRREALGSRARPDSCCLLLLASRLVGALQGEDARPKGTDEMGIRTDIELHAEFFLQCAHHADVERNPARESHFRFNAD